MTNIQIDELSEQLNNENSSEAREEAIYELGEFTEEKSLKVLIERLPKENNSDVIQMILHIIGKIGNEKTIPILFKYAGSNDIEVCLTAINSLGKFSSSQEANIALVNCFISQSNNNLRTAIVKQLANFDSKETCKVLLDCLTDDSKEIFLRKEASLSAMELIQNYPPAPAPEPKLLNNISALNNLVNRLKNKGWELVEEIYEQVISSLTDSSQPLFQPCSLTIASVDSSYSEEITKKIKQDIELDKEHNVTIMISLTHESDEIFNVLVTIEPCAEKTYLPADLKIFLASLDGDEIDYYQTGENNKYINLQPFPIASGYSFEIKLSLDNFLATRTVEI